MKKVRCIAMPPTSHDIVSPLGDKRTEHFYFKGRDDRRLARLRSIA